MFNDIELIYLKTRDAATEDSVSCEFEALFQGVGTKSSSALKA